MTRASIPTIALALAAGIGAVGYTASTPHAAANTTPVVVAQMGSTPAPIPSVPTSPVPSPTGSGM